MFRCYKCKSSKPITDFYKSNRNPRGLDDYCKPCRRARSLVYTRANSERMRENVRSWREANPEKVKEHSRFTSYRKAYNAISRHRRRARLACVEYEEGITLELLFQRDKGICGICSGEVTKNDWSIDHIKPIAKFGGHTWSNVQLAHMICNSRKQDNEDYVPETIFKGFRSD